MTRIAILDRDKCQPKKCAQECKKACPRVRVGEEAVVIGPDGKPIIDEGLCVGCAICIKKCPFGAISIINLPEALKEDPIFRYGPNAFELFRLPIPKKKEVVGLLGRNGVGKTTALKLLSNLLKPNLGRESVEEKDILDHFKGTELQAYFKNLNSDKIKVSYKIQEINLISKQFKGTAKQLLNKFSKNIKNISKKLGLDDILNSKLSKLSGGELQKVVVAAAILKEADLYFFDEPASYLDIKERIRVAKVIRELAEKGKPVIVIEHDLLILDYLTDSTHLLFGKSGAYGIVSHPLSERRGLNTYLDGYLSDENIRFRDKPIKFDPGALKSELSQETLILWPKMAKKLGKFNLEVEPSEIKLGEIVGIIGANGIGKTTFMKMLAGELKPDEGKLNFTLKISYKPQYIEANKGLVLDVLKKINKKLLTIEGKNEILEPLEVIPLLEKDLTELSGGELQRVAIAACLGRDADLYLLDEPSNYLDVEQRLHVAKTLRKISKKKNASFIIIDHDLLFLSYFSSRFLVFTGEPAKKGVAKEIAGVKEGMNSFLKELDVTLRKDPDSGRPRVNKLNSRLDREQKSKNHYWYFE
ncbi:MAG: ribosome biogenesis/translation initiation ATPase RLI [Candidatus Woesearchaeota archaeon]|nr:MAG: ribosome biogenesis/translation initiation ATPase RLI [Candidatus Woesearchaeota archaeon]